MGMHVAELARKTDDARAVSPTHGHECRLLRQPDRPAKIAKKLEGAS